MLRKEFEEYLRLQPLGERERLKRTTAIRFGRDMYDVLALPVFDEDLIPEGAEFSFAEFEKFFLSLLSEESVQGLNLSESINQQYEEKRGAVAGVSQRLMVDVPHRNMLEPSDEDSYCVPGQSFHLEWGLIFNLLEPRDLNAVNLTCKFFRTCLDKHPPSSWRIARISSLEARNATNIGESMARLDQLRTIIRLEVGTMYLGTMLSDKDLKLIAAEMRQLKYLKLLYCHLVSQLAPMEQLESLTLFQMKVSAKQLTGFPNLRHLVIFGSTVLDELDQFSLGFYLLDLKRLEKLGLGSIEAKTALRDLLSSIGEMPTLRYLWLESKARHGALSKRLCFEASVEEEVQAVFLSRLRLVEYVVPEVRMKELKLYLLDLKDSDNMLKAITAPKGEMANYSWSAE